MIKKLINEFSSKTSKSSNLLYEDPSLIAPHGNKLVQNIASIKEKETQLNSRKIIVDDSDLMDAEQIALGTFSPLDSFMDQKNLNSVLENNKLLDGNIWTLPIILQVNADKIIIPEKKERIILRSKKGEDIAFLDVKEIYTLNLNKVATKWFGTDSPNHPGVKKFLSKGNTVLSGKVTLIKRRNSRYRSYELTPHETRYIFCQKNWSRIVGFHTRNPAHKVHEYIQLKALEDSEADGLFINPVIGEKKSGDFSTEVILESYQLMIAQKIYPQNSVLLSGFNTYSRYSGPREAIFTAICRKNLGCSHFIIGRDHTGIKNFYKANENKKFFNQLENIGIELIFFDQIGFDTQRKEFTNQRSRKEIKQISATEIRNAFGKKKRLPSWYMRKEIQDMILTKINKNQKVFL